MNSANQEIFNTLFMVFLVAILLTVVVAIVLFLLFFLKRKVKGTVPFFPSGTALPNDEFATFFSSVRHDANSNIILFTQAFNFKRCVVTLVYSNNGKKGFKRYVLQFNESQKTCGIKLDNLNISEYNIFVESVDGKYNKHAPYENTLLFAIIYGAVVAVLYAVSIIILIVADSYQLLDVWNEYAIYYGFAAIGLLFPLIGIGGFVFVDLFNRK